MSELSELIAIALSFRILRIAENINCKNIKNNLMIIYPIVIIITAQKLRGELNDNKDTGSDLRRTSRSE